MNKCSAYVGLDVHKDTIAAAVALPGREEPVYRGEIKNQRKSLLRLIRSLSPHAEVLSFCYEAGPCGYGVYREIIDTGHYCEVVAPSLIPRCAGERVKTDRRDAVKSGPKHRFCSHYAPVGDAAPIIEADEALVEQLVDTGAEAIRTPDRRASRTVDA